MEFGPIRIAGPARVYAPLGAADEIIDTDADLGTNLRAAVDHFLARHGDGPLAFLACDVLPTVAELRAVMDRYPRHACA